MKSNSKINKSSMVFMLVLALALISVGFLMLFLNQTGADEPVVADPVDITSSVHSIPWTELAPSIKNPPKTAKVLGVGDNLIHSGLYTQAKKRAGNVGYDFSEAYKEMADIISGADIASLNQETMLADIYEPSSYPLFNSPSQLGDEMIDLGFDLINQANNHSLDKGEKGILSTLQYWGTKPEVKVVGVYKNVEDYNNIRTIEKNGIVFSFLGMTELTNGLNLPQSSDVILARTSDHNKIKERIAAAKAISDVVVVNVHWGVEYTHSQNSSQTALAKLMIESGADIIFGHHPHVIQPIEYITRADGTKGIVCYSLGNFISAQNMAPRMLGGMLEVEVTKDNGITTITAANYIPVVTHYGKGFTNIKNYPFSKYTPELANTHGVSEFSPEFSYNYLKETINNVIDPQFMNN